MKILIVDDEISTRNGLKKYIHWDMLGIDEIQDVGNAFDAIDLSKTYQPDIILSDICMPGMDGIQLCRQLRQHQPNCRIIFLSGYSEKEYLKAAIALSAVSYVEKPIEIPEVEHAIKAAVDQCLQEQNQKRELENINQTLINSLSLIKNRVVSTLISSRNTDAVEHDLKLLDNLFQKKEDFYLVIIFKLKNESADWQQEDSNIKSSLAGVLSAFEHIITYKDSRHLISIISCDNAADLKSHGRAISAIKQAFASESIDSDGMYCAIGQPEKGLDRVIDSYQKAVIALQKLFFHGYGNVVEYSDTYSDNSLSNTFLYDEFTKSFDNHDKALTTGIVNKIYDFFKTQDNVLINNIKHIYLQMIYQLMHSADKFHGQLDFTVDVPSDYIWEKVSSMDTLQELHDFLMEKVDLVFNYFQDLNSNHATILDVAYHIQQNYSDVNLSVPWLAEKVYLSPTYLSNLFKKETGKTIGQYITAVRIERSKAFLRDKQFKLYHIAESVGYQDPNYYAKMFKKLIGITPSEFREKGL
ncbi:response regulator [Ruminiclostridium cellobioparum]|uniref:Stage 0 sporulation protein A homolog n=1 Tax=Ruminiclostridium cellobioparum subsp. termitidis CT1112 TaxID=1195236 RepID=S0FGV9_RUMCE|nr:response regulator [Ruminiclostridium cellobioparum]EMS70497.1 two component transcriptional regulator, AraC family protein [Ruminiclostridium cellobioparum subsp. termitidis CT1112]